MFFSSPWIRTPEFPKNGQFNYNSYWKERGWEISKKLKPREKIILDIVPKGSRVFDIGCGNSGLPVALKEKGVDMTIADVSTEVLVGYKEFGIEGRYVDLERISEQTISEQFDYIIMSEVLEHTKNPEEIILTLSAHTKHFILTVPNSAAYMFRFGLLFKGRFFTQWVMHPSEHLRYWSHIDFLDWMKAMGLTVTKVVVSDGFTFRGLLPSLPNIWKNFLGFRMVYVAKVEK